LPSSSTPLAAQAGLLPVVNPLAKLGDDGTFPTGIVQGDDWCKPFNSPTGSRPLEVRTQGLSSYYSMYIAVTLVPAAILYGCIAWEASTPTAAPLPVVVGAVTAVLVLMFLWAENLQGIRKVVVSENGVRFSYLFHAQSSQWSELSLNKLPQPDALKRGGFYILRSIEYKGKPSFRMHFVTRDQAVAILTYSACSIREIETGTRSYLGL